LQFGSATRHATPVHNFMAVTLCSTNIV
jgi:hypothetical protein